MLQIGLLVGVLAIAIETGSQTGLDHALGGIIIWRSSIPIREHATLLEAYEAGIAQTQERP
eukprot:11293111-Alexandrium_andersonii.AAC.1